MKLGLFAGTFDPIHQGHISFAKAAITEVGLDRVLFMPEPRPRGKTGVTGHKHRLRMVEMALTDEKQMDAYSHLVDQFTLDNTLPFIYEHFTNSELYILLGSDTFAHLLEWPELKRYANRLTFIVGRSSDSLQLRSAHSRLRVMPLYHPNKDYSSSDVRQGKTSAYLPLLKYIQEHNLYI